jgi:hypothetical protein
MIYMSEKTFLDALKPGDKVAVKDRALNSFARDFGYRIYTVVKISPKRTKFSCQNVAGETVDFVDFDKHGSHRTGSGFHSHYFDMEPVTEETYASIKRDTALIEAKRLASGLEGHLIAFQRDNNPDPIKVERFLESCYELKVLFDID